MPRKARIDAQGALHHVIIRGIERRKIFRSDLDRMNFLNRLSILAPETETECFAWAILPNHVHLLLRTGAVPISVLMNRLLTGYAGWFNKKYRRHGQLFQNRYKSILCQENPYLKELVRYIHLNPLRDGLAEDMEGLDKYPWCGHSVLMNKTSQSWQNIDYVYGLFSDKKREARKRYREFVEYGISEGKRPDLTGGGLLRSSGGWTGLKGFRKAGIRVKGDERILGDSDFVESVLKSAEEALEEKYELKTRGVDFDRVVCRVAEVMDMSPEQVTALGKSPQTVKARALLCFWAHRKLGVSTVEIAKKLRISQPAVSRAAKRGERLEKEKQFELLTDKRIKK
ncbi:MAG: transposase [Desulfobacterales bacterium]|jgi:REP element-mobilizing transposase RayT|nr:transposase [Desulfobacterales bacterium]MDD3080673.1 transposase [Desulfobacterales bacterium]MDD3949680.1 transposase [Desulfobacterales bacterium]MDD4463318.1 transposase [Desulfobacterales bacterium]MDY0377889.1 transposase [Desulfobacterales bacterium]